MSAARIDGSSPSASGCDFGGRRAGTAFLVLAAAFVAIGLSGQQTFLAPSIAFFAVWLVVRRRSV
ncbi:MAG: hypothetical protein IT176_02150 [Acidobacteria bacterium]|nr:hypothetical protein [Acidobacteriota bacterium]